MTDNLNDPRLLSAPADPDLLVRLRRLRELGLGNQPLREFDEVADRLADAANAPYAMVNFVSGTDQFFAGLHVPSRREADAIEAAQAVTHQVPGRTMARDHGYCPHVVVRKKALVLDDVCRNPRWAGNPVVNALGVRAYIGAPLIDPVTGVALGTICAVSTETSTWGRPGLDMIKSMAAEVVDLISKVERRR